MSNKLKLEYSKEEILQALTLNNFYVLTTAKQLNMPRSRLYVYIREYNIVLTPVLGVQPENKINNKTVNNIYYKMKNRCFNENCKDYIHYGARGIKVHEEWLLDRDSFSKYIMSLPHFGEDDYSLDRIDNNGNYEPGNVKFSTRKEQANNTRRNRLIEYNGEIITLIQFYEKYAENTGVTYDYILDRFKLGFTPEEVLNLPKCAKRKFSINNISKQNTV